MKLSKEFAEIALQVGGSHYQDVGGALLQKFGEELVRRCAQVADSDTSHPHQTYGKMILDRFGVKQ